VQDNLEPKILIEYYKLKYFGFKSLLLGAIAPRSEKGVINLQLVVALVLNAAALLATAYIVPGFKVDNFTTALLAAIVLGVVNTFIKPVISYVTHPINVVTLGLFAFVVNALVLFIVSYFVPGLTIDGWVPAILGAIVLSVVATVLSSVLKDVSKLKLK